MSVRDTLRAAAAAPPEPFEHALLKAPLFLRMLTVGQILSQQVDIVDENDRPAILRAFARVVCEADGTPIYDGESTDDMAELKGLPWSVVKAAMEKSAAMNSLDIVAAKKD
jgi:hypothetical protein